jgi:hypothetical protein
VTASQTLPCRLFALLGIWVTLFALAAPAVAAECTDANLLRNRRHRSAERIANAERINDGIGAPATAKHAHPTVAVAQSVLASVSYDLTRPYRLDALHVLADHDAELAVMGSVDGTTFQTLFEVPTHPNPGIHPRVVTGLDATVRHLKLVVTDASRPVALAELQAFCEAPTLWPPALAKHTRKFTPPREAHAIRLAVGATGLLTLLLLPLARRRPSWRELAATLAGCATLGIALSELWSSPTTLWPWLQQYGSMAAVVAAVITVASAAHGIRTGTASRWVTHGPLALLLVASAVTWPSFWRHGVHQHEMLHYDVGSRYFQELRHDGLYTCVVKASLEDGNAYIETWPVRDLTHTDRVLTAQKLVARGDCDDRFSAARWDAFKHDVRMYRSTMPVDAWKGAFMDHGYNPPPLWTLLGGTVARSIPPPPPPAVGQAYVSANTHSMSSEQRTTARRAHQELVTAHAQRLVRLATFDALQYAAVFALISMTFGLRAGALAALVWAVGTPWESFWTVGGFGRIGWLLSATGGVCALRWGRPVVAGIALTTSALLRVFPLVFLAAALLKNAPSIWARLRTGSGPWLAPRHQRLVLSTAATALLGVGVSALAVGPGSYPDFFENIALHGDTPLTNNMGLPVVLAAGAGVKVKAKPDAEDAHSAWKDSQRRGLSKLRALHLAGVLLVGVLLIRTSTELEDWELAAFGSLMVSSLFSMTNYYYVFLILLAPVAATHPRRTAAFLCAAMGTTLVQLQDPTFQGQALWSSVILIALQVALLADRAWLQDHSLRLAREPLQDQG